MLRMAGIRSTRLGTTLVLSLALTLVGCAAMGGGTSNPQPSSTVAVTPATGSVRAGDTLQFTAKVSGTMNQSVVWSVNGVVGGNATDGLISTSGVYTAPAALPAPIPVGNFTIALGGSNFLNGAPVIFGGTMLTTTFISSTSLSASGTSSTAGTVALEVINPGTGSPTSNTLQVQVGSANTGVTAAAAARFLEQSTFGPTPTSIQHVQQVGLQAFLNEQYSATASTYPTPGANDNMETAAKAAVSCSALQHA